MKAKKKDVRKTVVVMEMSLQEADALARILAALQRTANPEPIIGKALDALQDDSVLGIPF